MKAALRIILISLRLRVRSITGGGWLLVAVGGILMPALSFTLGKSLAWSSPGPQYLLPFLTGALNFLLMIQLGTAFSTAFYHLYLARDLPLFLVSPVRPRSVILAKLLEVAAAGVGTFAVAGIPLLVSLGVAWYAPPWYYALSVLAGLLFALLPAIFAILSNLLVCRILPPYRIKEVTAALGTIIGALIYFFSRMALTTAGWGNSTGDVSGVSSIFGRMGPTWSPSALLARAAIEGLSDRPIPLIATATMLLFVSTGLFAAVLNGTERAYLSGWMVSGESKTRRRGKQVAQRHITSETGQRGSPAPASVESPLPLPPTPQSLAAGADGDRRPLLSVERMSFAVESKLLFRDLQSQSQVVYVLVMVLALAVFPGRTTSTDWLDSLSPFFFLIMAGSYASWAVKNMPATIRLLGQYPCNPTRVMRGKAFFYGLIQACCASVLFVVVKAFNPLARSEEALILLTFSTALALSTGATSVCAAAYDFKTAESTGVPRLGAAGGIALALVNAVLAGVCLLGYLIAVPMIRTRPFEGWVWVALVVATQAAGFFVATNMAGNRVRRMAGGDDGGSGGSGASGSDGSSGRADGDSSSGGSSGAQATPPGGRNQMLLGNAEKTHRVKVTICVIIACLLGLSCLAGRSPASVAPTRVAAGGALGSWATLLASVPPLTAPPTSPASIDKLPCHDVNGARVYIQRLPEEGLAQIGAVMLVGTADQREDETHCAHMAEHMALMYPGPSSKSVWSIAAESYSLGSTLPLQGETGPDYTAFVMAVPEEETLHTLSIFLDSLFRTTLTDDSAFQMEIKRGRHKLTVMTTHDEVALLNKLRLGMCKGTCYWEDLFGTPLTEVSADKVRAFMEREYTPARLSLVILSDCSEAEILDCVARGLESIPPGKGPSDHSDVRFDPPETDILLLRPDEQRAGLAVGVSGVSSEDMAAVEALLNIATKRLYADFRRSTGARMEASLHRVLMTKSTAIATFGFTARTSAHSIEASGDQNAVLLREILASLAAQGPSLSELSRFAIPGSTQSQMQMPVLPPYWEAEMLAIQLIPRVDLEDLLLTEPDTSPEYTQAILKAAAAKYLPDAKVTVVYVRDLPSSTATWLILGGALAIMVAVVWWRVAKGRGSRRPSKVGD
jgi:predicted Zn-dependent peptidase/uncharacterized membrane protein YgcG